MDLVEFLQSPNARTVTDETVGVALSGTGKLLASGRYGGKQLAYDVTALVPGIEPIQLADGYLDGGVSDPVAGRQGCMSIVGAMRAQAIVSRMTCRVAVKFGLADETPDLGNALVYLTPPALDVASMAGEIALLVCCFGLTGLHNEYYAELLAAKAKGGLLDEWIELNTATDEDNDDTAVVTMFGPQRRRPQPKPRSRR